MLTKKLKLRPLSRSRVSGKRDEGGDYREQMLSPLRRCPIMAHTPSSDRSLPTPLGMAVTDNHHLPTGLSRRCNGMIHRLDTPLSRRTCPSQEEIFARMRASSM